MTFADPKDWPANRRLWTEALRDPSRKRVTGRLGHQEDGGQCPLGVLAELAGCERTGDGWDHFAGALPKRAVEFVGLRSRTGFYAGGSLVRDNDNEYMTFTEIADVIESEPAGLFREVPE